MIEILYDIVTRSSAETIAFGRRLAAHLASPGVVILEGDLGSGKTTLTKGVVAGLGAAREEDVTSPSFTLVHEYRKPPGPATCGNHPVTVFHVDLYRVEGAREAESLGLDDLFNAHSTVMIEWGDKLKELPQGPLIRIKLEVVGEDQRRIFVERVVRKRE